MQMNSVLCECDSNFHSFLYKYTRLYCVSERKYCMEQFLILLFKDDWLKDLYRNTLSLEGERAPTTLTSLTACGPPCVRFLLHPQRRKRLGASAPGNVTHGRSLHPRPLSSHPQENGKTACPLDCTAAAAARRARGREELAAAAESDPMARSR